MDQQEPADDRTYQEKRLATFEALYRRFGREGLRDQPIAEVGLWLASKELKFRDTPKHNITEAQQAANRQLELEIMDIRAYVKGQTAGLTIDHLRAYGNQREQQQGQYRQKDRGHGR